ncbi:MAG: metal ABC transporter permease, partial [Verrucomicrobia bacterium]|nr:metal ABC transporter permease [Verrucomicrobiota bacterium]
MISQIDTSTSWLSAEQFMRVLQFQDHNTRVVVLGAVLLGIAAGMIGTFMLLRKRALMGDAVSHATLPGIGIAFLIMASNGGDGRWLPGLLIGATLAGLIGMGAVLLVRSQTRLKEDAALGIVLSVFFGLGVAILGIIQQLNVGSAAGLESFIYGKTASMLARDSWLIAGMAMAVLLFCICFFKEFAMICFDQQYANSQGWNVAVLDVLMMALVVLVTVIGLQAVGLILMIALLVTPPAAARFWTDHLKRMMIISALVGAASGYFGSIISALVPRLP